MLPHGKRTLPKVVWEVKQLQWAFRIPTGVSFTAKTQSLREECFTKWKSQPPLLSLKNTLLINLFFFLVLALRILTPLWTAPNVKQGTMLRDLQLAQVSGGSWAQGGSTVATFIHLQLQTLSLEAGKDSDCCRLSQPEHWLQKSPGEQVC